MRLRQADSGASITSTFVLPAQSGVTVHERRASARFRRAMSGLGQGSDWEAIYLAQREEAVKRHGSVIIDEGFARTVFPNVSRQEGLALVDWWWDRLLSGLGQGVVFSATLTDNERTDLANFDRARADLNNAPSWGGNEIKGAWDVAQLAATRLSASAAVVAADEGNTWLRAFKESVEDITGSGTDPFGVGKWIRRALIAGGVIVGGFVILNVWSSVRRALPPPHKEGT